MGLPRITSRQHLAVQRFRAAAVRRGDADGVLLDGEHLIEEALAAQVPIDLVLADRTALTLAMRAQAAGAAVYEASRPVLEAASPVRSPGGIVALAKWAPVPVTDAFTKTPALVLGLVDVQDPGNVGSAIRSGAALGATAVVAIDASANPGGWKALRGAMGSTFAVPVARASLRTVVAEARRRQVDVIAAVADGGTPIEETDLSGPMLLLLGNEGAGLAGSAIAMTDRQLTIPMGSGVSSLNVAVTAALVLWEARRQREARQPVR